MKPLAVALAALAAASPLRAQHQPEACHPESLGLDRPPVSLLAYGPAAADSTTPEARFTEQEVGAVLDALKPIDSLPAPNQPAPDTGAFDEPSLSGALAIVWFQVRNDGRLSGMSVARHSRWSAVDIALQRGVLRADSLRTLKPLPDTLRNQAIDLYIAAGPRRVAHGDVMILGMIPGRHVPVSHEPPRLLHMGHTPHYPVLAGRAGMTDSMTVSYIVDATGRVDSSSIRFFGGRFGQLEEEVIRTVVSSRFAPARTAGCAVRVRVEQPARFGIRQYRPGQHVAPIDTMPR